MVPASWVVEVVESQRLRGSGLELVGMVGSGRVGVGVDVGFVEGEEGVVGGIAGVHAEFGFGGGRASGCFEIVGVQESRI